jgi:hypothetical protein
MLSFAVCAFSDLFVEKIFIDQDYCENAFDAQVFLCKIF